MDGGRYVSRHGAPAAAAFGRSDDEDVMVGDLFGEREEDDDDGAYDDVDEAIGDAMEFEQQGDADGGGGRGHDEPATPVPGEPDSPAARTSPSSSQGPVAGGGFFPGGHSWQQPGGTAASRRAFLGRDDAESDHRGPHRPNGPNGAGPSGAAAPSPASGRGHANQTDLGGRGGHLHGMAEYRNIPQLMKVEAPVTPVFPHGIEGNGGWLDYTTALGIDPQGRGRTMRPVRAMCFNLPVDLFSTDAYRFKHVATNLDNPTRATNLCALFGLLWTGVSKGWQSGDHAELHRASDLQDPGDEQPQKTKKEPTFARYMYVDESEGVELPMFVVGYEELYDSARENVVAIRVWKFVFDGSHSDSKLVDKLMRENQDRLFHAGAAHCSNSHRSSRLVVEHERAAKLVGSASPAEVSLEWHGCNQYMRICTLPDYRDMLPSYGGRSDTHRLGMPPIDVADIPPGTLNASLREATNGEGGQSPLSPEFVFNAKRPSALQAGLIGFNDQLLDVCPDQLDPQTYFDLGAGGTHDFSPPAWLRDCCGMWLQSDPYKRHPFDMALPRALSAGEKPGPTLLQVFATRVLKDPTAATKAHTIERFRGMMKEEDQATAKLLQETADAIFTFDATTCSEEERKGIMMAKKLAKKGMKASVDGKETVICAREVREELAEQTARVHAKLVAPYIHEARLANAQKVAEQMAKTLTTEEEIKKRDDELENLKAAREHAEYTHTKLQQELFYLAADRLTRAFNSRVDKSTIDTGSCAVWDGLQRSLDEMPNRSANVAFGLNDAGVQLTDAQRTTFGHMINWFGSWFEDECQIDGRDWRILQQFVFGHCYDPWMKQTRFFTMIGRKGNGKSTMLLRALASFSPGRIVRCGPRSARAGMQGNSDAINGCVALHDEMPADLLENGGEHIEFTKQCLTDRQFVYVKVVAQKTSDGTEAHRTLKIITKHKEAPAAATNNGHLLMRHATDEPSEVKMALIDRMLPQQARTFGGVSRPDDEFQRHLNDPEVAQKLPHVPHLDGPHGAHADADRGPALFHAGHGAGEEPVGRARLGEARAAPRLWPAEAVGAQGPQAHRPRARARREGHRRQGLHLEADERHVRECQVQRRRRADGIRPAAALRRGAPGAHHAGDCAVCVGSRAREQRRHVDDGAQRDDRDGRRVRLQLLRPAPRGRRREWQV